MSSYARRIEVAGAFYPPRGTRLRTADSMVPPKEQAPVGVPVLLDTIDNIDILALFRGFRLRPSFAFAQAFFVFLFRAQFGSVDVTCKKAVVLSNSAKLENRDLGMIIQIPIFVQAI